MDGSAEREEKPVLVSLLDLPNIAWTYISTFFVIIWEYLVGAVLQISNYIALDKWSDFITTNLTTFWNFITEKAQQISEFLEEYSHLVMDALPKFMEKLSNISNIVSLGSQSVFEFLKEYFNFVWHFVMITLDKWLDFNFFSTNMTIYLNFITEKAQKTYQFLEESTQDVFEFLQFNESRQQKEFTLWMGSFFIFLCFHCFLFYRRPSKSELISRFIQMVQFNCLFGCLLFLVNGIKVEKYLEENSQILFISSGEIFGGKIIYSTTMALMAILIQNIGYLVTKAKEISGYGYEDEAVDTKIKDLFDILGQAFPLVGTVCLFIAVFGLEFDSIASKLLVPLPILGFLWEGRKWLDILNNYEKISNENDDTQSMCDIKPDIVAQPTAQKDENVEPETEVKEKPVETKIDTSKVAKNVNITSPTILIEFIRKTGEYIINFVNNQVLDYFNSAKNRIIALPWDIIISLATTLGVLGGTTYAYWTLTEARIVFAAPTLTLLGPFVLTKLQDKSWLDETKVQFGYELLATLVMGIQYHLYRTYIKLPEENVPMEIPLNVNPIPLGAAFGSGMTTAIGVIWCCFWH